MASRNEYDLSPDTFELWAKFDTGMHKAAIDYVLTCTYRSDDEQGVLFAQGRTAPGSIVTNAPPGKSAHNCFDDANQKPAARAFDVVPILQGKPCWDRANPVWQMVGKIGKAIGLDWAGDWKSFPEFPHFQLPNWKAA